MNQLQLAVRYIWDSILNLVSREPVVLISEPATWAIYEDCKNIQRHLRGVIPIRIAFTPFGLRNKIVHFASVNTLVRENGLRRVHASNTVVLTWFHVVHSDEDRLAHIPAINQRVSLVHTSCTLTKDILVRHGLAAEKVVIIPIGVDTAVFCPGTVGEKEQLRAALNIPMDTTVIGSFQKDGNGWGAGNTPKLVKGPDIFCDVVERIAKQHQLHVLLTGPARGYVRDRLDAAGIPYTHRSARTSAAIAKYYRALDAYLVTSRAEGGPKAILEASASGIPVVTTRVGMVPDIMQDGLDCMIAPIEDVSALAEKTRELLRDSAKRSQIAAAARDTAMRYDIRTTVRQYYDQIYRPLLNL